MPHSEGVNPPREALAWPSLRRLADWIDAFNERVGVTVAWLTLVMVVVQFALVLMRYVFGIASIFVQEIVLYAHATVFLVAGGYAMRHDSYVRIDIFYANMPARTKSIVDLAGTLLFLLPLCGVVAVTAWPYVVTSWGVLEQSRDASGIPAVFVLKSLILAFSLLIFLQGIATAIRSVLVLCGRSPGLSR